ncbi:MAG: hypothetical protein ACYTG1_01995 [Planctomycetota bacterium]
MLELPCSPLILLVLAAVPALTAEQQARLATARDGRDHREEAFAALLENVEGWTGDPGDAPVRLRPDPDRMTGDPARYRGDLCRLAGVLQQRTRLDPPFEHVHEWFIRDDEGRPILVYVLEPGDAPTFAPGARVRLLARFYKRAEEEARDGRRHVYAAFVGAAPTRAAPAGELRGLVYVAVPVVIMFAVFLLLLLGGWRRRSAGRARSVPPEAPVDDPRPLPDDPAAALTELRRRAGRDDAPGPAATGANDGRTT